MGGAAPLMWLAAALGVAGVGVLRFAWSLPRRSAAVNAVGWNMLFASAIAASFAEGAWGIAVAAIPAMATAMIALAVAGARSPNGRETASNRRVGMLPEGTESRRIGRRLATFGLVMIAGAVVSVGLAAAVRGLGGVLGWGEANANALALFTAPLAWAVLCTVLLMQTRRSSQVLTLALCALPAVPVLLSGALS